MRLDFHIEGLDQLIAEAERMQAVTPQLVDQALIAGGELLKERMIAGVYLHGLLRRSGEAQRAIRRTKPNNGELFVGTQGGAQKPGFYLYMHEFGFYNVRAGRFIAPKPFASVIFENSRLEIIATYAAVFRTGYRMS